MSEFLFHDLSAASWAHLLLVGLPSGFAQQANSGLLAGFEVVHLALLAAEDRVRS